METAPHKIPIVFYGTFSRGGSGAGLVAWAGRGRPQHYRARPHAGSIPLAGGMPLCRPLGDGVWEVRSGLTSNRIARVLFCFTEGRLLALHGFIKKTQKTPDDELKLARKRKREFI